MFRFSPRTNRAHLITWWEWGDEAFHAAQQRDKPVVVFLTAFWCGYCQRMDETSLSNDEVIALLNAFFVPIRVEESQRPDVDLRYNQHGWPTIAFLTPTGDHLVSVNYTAPEPFTQLLVRLVDAYQRDKSTLLEAAARNRADALARQSQEAPAPLGAPIVAEIAGMVEGLADPVHGGYGTKNKFLHMEANEFLLYLFEATGTSSYLDHVRLTLDKMRHSRTFDTGDGGFFRYSSRVDWQEPHPEKLLDDQAALLRNYLRTYLLTDQASYRETAEGLVDYLNTTLSEATQPCFFGCQDYVRPDLSIAANQTSGPPPLLSCIDEFVYCDANARAASAYLDAWWLLGREDCQARALNILETLWDTLRAPDGGMFHYSDGAPRVPGLLMDSVMTGLALLDAYAVCGHAPYLGRARQLAEDIRRQHRNAAGGFFDISMAGPASLQYPVTVLTQNANVASFFVRLADLSGDIAYRQTAHWALRRFPNAHRTYEAFAAGFGHALGRLLALPLIITITGVPGDARVRSLARAALTQLHHGDLVLRFREDRQRQTASAEVHIGDRLVGPIADPASLRREVLTTLHDTPKGVV
ncbi:MAG: DUF255 domain-containing protein [Candidatus Entotheonellia bacterium]